MLALVLEPPWRGNSVGAVFIVNATSFHSYRSCTDVVVAAEGSLESSFNGAFAVVAKLVLVVLTQVVHIRRICFLSTVVVSWPYRLAVVLRRQQERPRCQRTSNRSMQKHRAQRRLW